LQKFNPYISSLLGAVVLLVTYFSLANPPSRFEGSFSLNQLADSLESDTLETDSLEDKPYEPSEKPTFTPQDRYGDPFSHSESPSPLLLKDPSSLTMDVEIDSNMNYTLYEKIGDLHYRPTTSMSFEEFNQYQEEQIIRTYWKNRSAALDGESAVSGRNLLPRLYFSPVFDRIFGGSYLELQKKQRHNIIIIFSIESIKIHLSLSA